MAPGSPDRSERSGGLRPWEFAAPAVSFICGVSRAKRDPCAPGNGLMPYFVSRYEAWHTPRTSTARARRTSSQPGSLRSISRGRAGAVRRRAPLPASGRHRPFPAGAGVGIEHRDENPEPESARRRGPGRATDTDTGTRSHAETPAARALGPGSVRNTRHGRDANRGRGRVFRTAHIRRASRACAPAPETPSMSPICSQVAPRARARRTASTWASSATWRAVTDRRTASCAWARVPSSWSRRSSSRATGSTDRPAAAVVETRASEPPLMTRRLRGRRAFRRSPSRHRTRPRR